MATNVMLQIGSESGGRPGQEEDPVNRVTRIWGIGGLGAMIKGTPLGGPALLEMM